MRCAGTLLVAALVIGACGFCYAQQTITGKVASVDKAGGKISIQLSGAASTSGAAGAPAPTPFKVQDASIFNAIKLGDQVSVTTKTVNGVPTITSLKKE